MSSSQDKNNNGNSCITSPSSNKTDKNANKRLKSTVIVRSTSGATTKGMSHLEKVFLIDSEPKKNCPSLWK